MHNYEKYVAGMKHDGLLLSHDLAELTNLPKKEVQEIARLLYIKKDAANIYVFSKKDVAKFLKFLLLRDE